MLFCNRTSGSRGVNDFFQSVERRAYQMACFATGNREDALDIVQDAMMAFVRRYADKPEEERRPLFFTILQNRIRDWHRRQNVRNRLTAWWLGKGPSGDQDIDPVTNLADPSGRTPEKEWVDSAAGEALKFAIGNLPLRQQQAFLLRSWEELSVAETARAMGCSEGSVKTHHARAVAALREQLKDQWP